MKNQLIIEMVFNCPCTQLTKIFCLILSLILFGFTSRIQNILNNIPDSPILISQ